MTIATKRLNNGFEMPEYGLGTWRMGGDVNYDPQNDDAADIRAIEIAIESGVRHIDSAEKYAAGHSETLLGRAIKRFDREQLFLATKFSSAHAAADEVVKSAEASLRRMQVDYLDLYMLHSFCSNVPLAETLGAMDALVDRGLVRAIGVSNFGSENLAKAQTIAKHPIAVNQVHYNLAVREVEHDGLVEYCQANDVMLVAWRPVRFEERKIEEAKLLDLMCEKYNKTRTQIVLNWLTSQNNVVTLSKTRGEKHLLENLGAFGWQMEAQDIEQLRVEYPNQREVSESVPLNS